MNLLDYNYKILVRNILKNGVSKRDRNRNNEFVRAVNYA